MARASLLLALLLGACGSCSSEDEPAERGATTGDPAATAPPEDEVPPAGEDDAVRAAAIARELRAHPDDSEQILEAHGLTIEEFEQLMLDIAADPELSDRYQAALGDEADPPEDIVE